MGIFTYLVLNASVLVVLVVVLRRSLVRDLRVWRTAALILIPLTIIFDSLCIMLGIFAYNSATISGLKIGPMPVEDLFYTVGAILIVPALWKLYGTKEESHVH